jgi:hypothetical protein
LVCCILVAAATACREHHSTQNASREYLHGLSTNRLLDPQLE